MLKVQLYSLFFLGGGGGGQVANGLNHILYSIQIYHSREALVESMGSEVSSTVLFSEGHSPEENRTVEGTEGPQIQLVPRKREWYICFISLINTNGIFQPTPLFILITFLMLRAPAKMLFFDAAFVNDNVNCNDLRMMWTS